MEIFYPPTGKYYQNLRDTTGNAPALLSGGIYTVNSAFWAECAYGYSGADWLDGTAYAVGVFVRNPADAIVYACHTAHTASGALDVTKFGVLTPFAPYVALDQTGKTPIGEVVGLTARDPRVRRGNPSPMSHTVRATGIIPLGIVPRAVWVEFRRRVPVFNSTPWTALETVVAGAVRYSATAGDCYTALAAIAGNSGNAAPEADAAKWALLEFPEVLSAFTIRSAGADLLRSDGQNEKADREQGQAYAELNDGRDIELEGQSLSETVIVQGY